MPEQHTERHTILHALRSVVMAYTLGPASTNESTVSRQSRPMRVLLSGIFLIQQHPALPPLLSRISEYTPVQLFVDILINIFHESFYGLRCIYDGSIFVGSCVIMVDPGIW